MLSEILQQPKSPRHRCSHARQLTPYATHGTGYLALSRRRFASWVAYVIIC